jgi:hypothetical protein
MDEAWEWGILWGIAILVTGSMIGIAPTIIDRAPRLGWWCVILSAFPLVVWDVLWVAMTNPPDHLRRSISITIGALAGAAILYGVTELLRAPANAQSGASSAVPSSAPSGGIQQYGPGQQIIAPSGPVYINPAPSTAPSPPVAPDTDHILQGGVIVGKVFGGRPLPSDATTYEFVEITNCNQFNVGEPFFYAGRKLLFISNRKRGVFDTSRPQDGMVRGYVLAKVID